MNVASHGRRGSHGHWPRREQGVKIDAGALIAGFGADATSASTAILIVAALTALSGLAVSATPWNARARLQPQPAD